MIEVDEHELMSDPLLAGLIDQFFHGADETRAVGKAGQRIMRGGVGKLALQRARIGEVLEDDDQSAEFVAFVHDRRHDLPDAAARLVAPDEDGAAVLVIGHHIQLKSHQTQYMARVGFEYPDEVNQKFAEINARMEATTIPGAGVPAENLNFGYRTSGRARWKPTRVYSDGTKTYIQFPSSFAGQDAPVLFVVSGGENRIVNYRVKGTMMIVDYMVDRAVLVSGVGWKQEKITIKRGG
ncbi:TrbG/VirB9 family P-type conjugative transfer protein [Mesorhizobium sp. B2-4-1]|uniref:TrbG/VirB9 family P-type conjugative transfer protein n=1 Tax=Mesorhizobium sp. B2-4-1 TaxID=2589948 RepID=UPI001FED7993|nr:TrbG/VirB9 family P-type conjugative transfer protein [Mesorhizobium sp. B2-4-1]